MGQIYFDDDNKKPPMAHPSVYTWVVIATALLMFATYVAWAMWWAGPTILR
jgi:hypothetical protein